ncbi:DUF1289 domain-containing protein [Afipia carboxidovorans]
MRGRDSEPWHKARLALTHQRFFIGGMSYESPCIAVCVISHETGLCRGCGRTRQEISDWATLTPEERATIMTTLVQRMTNAGMKVSPALVRWLEVCC